MSIGAIWGDIWDEAIWDTSIWEQAGVPNNAPVILDQIFSVHDGATEGQVVGIISASDPDSDPLTFTSLDISSDLELSSDGIITVATGVTLDIGTTPSYSFTVTADDGTDTTNASMTVNVVDQEDTRWRANQPCIHGAVRRLSRRR